MTRISIDTGGTFTDAVLLDEEGALWLGKSPTRPDRGWLGVEGALQAIGDQLGRDVPALLADCELFLYGTTRSTNAILTGTTAKTALLTTEGFADILVMREGGRLEPFNLRIEYPSPYVDRNRTHEIRERVDAEGGVLTPLDLDRTRATIERVRDDGTEAVAVCLLWSVLRPDHELQIGALLEEIAPDLPFTLSHQINPIMREYRRASSAAIDASLKPLMERHFADLERDLRDNSLAGDLLVFTSLGGVMQIEGIRNRPVLTVKSGPSMAPIAARAQTALEESLDGRDLIVCDTGGTSFDVCLVPDGEIKFTRDTVLGRNFTGYMTGLSSVDIRSIGSGGGSIAWVDSGGLLRVGPQSAGAEPGPACYGRGGEEPTVTDAAALSGYLDAESFANGRMPLDLDAAEAAMERLADQLGLSVAEAAHGVLTVATEDMIGAIKDITINEGVDPRSSLLVAGGGAAGLNIVPIARELGVRQVLVPRTAGALSASGGQYADIVHQLSLTMLADTSSFPVEEVNGVLRKLEAELRAHAKELGAGDGDRYEIDYSVEARYPFQAWEIEVPLRTHEFATGGDVEALAEAFHTAHLRTFAINEPSQSIECVHWKGRLTLPLEKPRERSGGAGAAVAEATRTSRAFFPGVGETDLPRHEAHNLSVGETIEGPAAIDEPTTTLVLFPGSSALVTANRNHLISVGEE
ncbi:MAG TPA: hydantoinase/oxoprolinase family protein [Solirubrobacterales bacterium]